MPYLFLTPLPGPLQPPHTFQDIIYRVCDGFSAKEYTCPKTSKERQLALADILIRLHDLNLVIERTEKHKLELLRGAAFELPEWLRQVHLQKCIFHTLNSFTFDTSGQFFIAECWVLERKMDITIADLEHAKPKLSLRITLLKARVVNLEENLECFKNFTYKTFSRIPDSHIRVKGDPPPCS